MPASRALQIIANHARRKTFAPGETLEVTPDLVALDASGAQDMIDAWRRAKGGRARGARRFLFVADPQQPAAQRRSVQAFGNEQRVALNLDPARMGWPGAVALEGGQVGAGDLIVGGTPDLGAVGGIGALALRARPEELVHLLKHKGLEIAAPPSLGVAIDGRLPRWVGPQDVALYLAHELGASARGVVLELTGTAITALPVGDRLVLCEALARAGLVALVPDDEAVRVWLAARRTSAPAEEAEQPKGPKSGSTGGPPSRPSEHLHDGSPELAPVEHQFKAERLGLLAQIDGKLVKPTGDDDRPVDEVVVAGSLHELRQAATALQERRIQPGLRFYVLPATRRTLLHALEEGLVTAFVRSGGILLTPGGTPPPTGRGDRRVTTRAADPRDVLTGPAVAAATAICGRLIDPETMRRENRRTAPLQ